MGQIVLDITMSFDGFVTAPKDGPSRGLGDHGEVLFHCRVARQSRSDGT